MRILGIDPGLSLTGYGCVEVTPHAADPVLIEGGVFRLKPKAPMPVRLRQLHDDLAQVIDELAPDMMVVEKLFTHYKHVRTGILMAHARGVVMLVGEMKGLRLGELSVTEIKRAVTGHGHASKQQVQMAVMSQCGLDKPLIQEARLITRDAKRVWTQVVAALPSRPAFEPRGLESSSAG